MTSLTYAILTQGNLKLHVITEDLSDDRYLERAAEGEAEYLEPLSLSCPIHMNLLYYVYSTKEMCLC